MKNHTLKRHCFTATTSPRGQYRFPATSNCSYSVWLIVTMRNSGVITQRNILHMTAVNPWFPLFGDIRAVTSVQCHNAVCWCIPYILSKNEVFPFLNKQLTEVWLKLSCLSHFHIFNWGIWPWFVLCSAIWWPGYCHNEVLIWPPSPERGRSKYFEGSTIEKREIKEDMLRNILTKGIPCTYSIFIGTNFINREDRVTG